MAKLHATEAASQVIDAAVSLSDSDSANFNGGRLDLYYTARGAAQIEKHDGQVKAFLHVDREAALAQAKSIDDLKKQFQDRKKGEADDSSGISSPNWAASESSPTPSVETLLHAFLPHRFIDHSHADAVLAPAPLHRVRENAEQAQRREHERDREPDERGEGAGIAISDPFLLGTVSASGLVVRPFRPRRPLVPRVQTSPKILWR